MSYKMDVILLFDQYKMDAILLFDQYPSVYVYISICDGTWMCRRTEENVGHRVQLHFDGVGARR